MLPSLKSAALSNWREDLRKKNQERKKKCTMNCSEKAIKPGHETGFAWVLWKIITENKLKWTITRVHVCPDTTWFGWCWFWLNDQKMSKWLRTKWKENKQAKTIEAADYVEFMSLWLFLNAGAHLLVLSTQNFCTIQSETFDWIWLVKSTDHLHRHCWILLLLLLLLLFTSTRLCDTGHMHRTVDLYVGGILPWPIIKVNIKTNYNRV